MKICKKRMTSYEEFLNKYVMKRELKVKWKTYSTKTYKMCMNQWSHGEMFM